MNPLSMKKEILISVLIGLTLGLIITYGVYRFRSSIADTPTNSLQEVASTTPTPELETSSVISVHNPQDGSVLSGTDLTVTGSTIANAYVVLFVDDTEIISNSDDAGNFSFQVKLATGPNILRLHVVNESGVTTVVERTVIVSPTEPTATASATTADEK